MKTNKIKLAPGAVKELKKSCEEIKVLLEFFRYKDLDDICTLMGGHNLDVGMGLFDLNYRDFTFTILDSPKGLEISDSVDYYNNPEDVFISNINLTDYINILDTPKGIMIQALEDFKKAAYDLTYAWEDFILDDLESVEHYPFQESFDEVCCNIGTWVEYTIDEIINPFPSPPTSLILPFIDKAKANGQVRAILTKKDGIEDSEWNIDTSNKDVDIVRDLEEIKENYYKYSLVYGSYGQITEIIIQINQL